MTCVCSFFSEARRVTSRDYIPSSEDILRAPGIDMGPTLISFKMDQLSLRLCDITRLQGRRKKWIHFLEGVTSVIFCTSLEEYDQVSDDGRVVCACICFSRTYMTVANLQNQLKESLVVFESVINSRWFLRTSIILFLTGIEKFKAKLPQVCAVFVALPP